MKTVQCPYCSTNFETIGFRPVNFQCFRCGADAEWYSGSFDGESRGLIAWSANDSTQSWLYGQYMSPIMQQMSQLEYDIQMDFYLLRINAQDVAAVIMEVIASLTEQLEELYIILNEATDPTYRAEILQQIEVIVKKIAVNQKLMVQIENIIVTIKITGSQLLVYMEQLKLAAEDSFYQIIYDITASNQANLPSDSATDEYSTDEVWRDFTEEIIQGIDDINRQLLRFNFQMKTKIRQIKSQIQR